ncbi:MAG: clostripain-related cysteine peptidase [Bacilli bacterium]|nr:clostripain-related cysteine peptidase [Bacilli bacterium]
MKKKKLILPITLLTLSLTFLSGCQTTITQPYYADWTVMIYLSGNTLEDPQGSASYNLAEIANNVTTNSKVNLVFQLGGTLNWHERNYGLVHEVGMTERYIYENNEGKASGQYRLYESMPNAYTGDPDVLTDYIVDTKTRFPAKKYSLWVWGHGMNANEGLLGDTTYSDKLIEMQCMSFNHLESALKNSNTIFENINFDCCLLSSVEMLSHLYGYTKYVTFSENEIPGTGQAYNTFFKKLYENPTMDGKQFGNTLVDLYGQRYPDNDKDGAKRCFVNVDVSKTPTLLKSFNNFYYEYAKELYSPVSFKKILNLHKEEGIFKYAKWMVDINQYMNKVKEAGFDKKSLCDPLINAVNNAVVSSTKGPETSTCGGISHCLWINDLYQNSIHDYDIYTMQASKLYGYIAFLDVFHQGWTAPLEIYSQNNIKRLPELNPFEFSLRGEYESSQGPIDKLKIISGEPVLEEVKFVPELSSKIIQDEGYMIITKDIRYEAGEIFNLVKNDNIYSVDKNDLSWVFFTPYYNNEDPEFKNITYPLTTKDVSKRVTNLKANQHLYLLSIFYIGDASSGEEIYLSAIYDGNSLTIGNYITPSHLQSLPNSFTIEQFNKLSVSISELKGKTISYAVTNSMDVEKEIIPVLTYDNFQEDLTKIFKIDDATTKFLYHYEFTDLLNKKQSLLIRHANGSEK